MKPIHYALLIACIYGSALTGYIVGDKSLVQSLPSPGYAAAVNSTVPADTGHQE